MPQVIACPNCQKSLKLPDEFLGKTVKCPACQVNFVAEGGSAPPPTSPPSQQIQPAAPPPPLPPPQYQAPPPAPFEDSGRDDYADDDANDDEFRRRKRRRRNRQQDHKGPLLMILGIVTIVAGLPAGFCICIFPLPLVLGVLTLILSIIDLNAMGRGDMNEEGRGMTKAGLICAIVGMILPIIFFVAMLLIQVVITASTNAGKGGF